MEARVADDAMREASGHLREAIVHAMPEDTSLAAAGLALVLSQFVGAHEGEP